MAGQPVFNDALAQIVADYGFGHVGFEDAAGITLFGHNSPMPKGGALEMAFSPANLVVQQALVDASKLPAVPDTPAASVAASELLRVLTSSALAAAPAPPAVASPAELERVPTVSPAVAPTVAPTVASEAPEVAAAPRKRKRAADTTDLLPLDAPIQTRKYRGASKTSRKPLPAREDAAAAAAADEEDELGEEASKPKTAAEAMLAKRLNNTLAARRSRHRKAEELKQLHDQIAALTSEADAWKRKAAALEAENARLRAQLP